jgi:hypothetical protein
MIVRLADNLVQFRVFDRQSDGLWTNNLLEQLIGKLKMRARTVRGYKTWSEIAIGLMAGGVVVLFCSGSWAGRIPPIFINGFLQTVSRTDTISNSTVNPK